jgi:hypothetical protein
MIKEIDLVLRNYTALFGLSSIFISGLTLMLTFRFSKQFGATHIKKKQVDHVCTIIEYLDSTKVDIDFSTYWQTKK